MSIDLGIWSSFKLSSWLYYLDLEYIILTKTMQVHILFASWEQI